MSRLDVEARLAAIAGLLGADRSPDEAGLRALATALADETKAVQRAAALAFVELARRGVTVRPLLEEELRAAVPAGRWGAVYALSRIGAVPVEALPILCQTLGSSDGDLRWAACDILVRGGAEWRPHAIAALLDLARRGDLLQRKMALYGLRDLDARGAASEAAARAALAEQSDRDLRLAGMAALARLADDRGAAARFIAGFLVDEEPRVRRAAAGTLGVLACADRAVLAALERASSDRDESTARAAERALARLRA